MHALLFHVAIGLSCLVAELWAARLGLWLALPVAFAFYLAVARGPIAAALWAIIAIHMTSQLHAIPQWPFFLSAIAIALFWRNLGDCTRPWLQLWPFALSLILASPLFLWLLHGLPPGFAWNFCKGIIASSCLIPPFISAADQAAAACGMPRYTVFETQDHSS